MAKETKRQFFVLGARGNQRGGISAEVATENMIIEAKSQLESSNAARKAKEYKKTEYELRKKQLDELMANPKSDPKVIKKLQEIVSNLSR
ncbi:MAG: hypothetical protein R8M37_01165 [Alphaproteobacteria bacterium]|nr:hypothetical protein [Alphaproteobacteria bacterium]